MATINGQVAAELAVRFPHHVPLMNGGRDLDNYPFPIAQRLVPRRLAAMFGRKTHGTSWLAVGPAQAETIAAPPVFSIRPGFRSQLSA
jgi:hypothetical protein